MALVSSESTRGARTTCRVTQKYASNVSGVSRVHRLQQKPQGMRRKSPVQSEKVGLYERQEAGDLRGANVLCASSCSSIESTVLLPDSGNTLSSGKKTPISRAWLNHMVPKLVKTLNKGGRREKGAVSMAFVCNESMVEPLSEVFPEGQDNSRGSASLDDWDVILSQIDSMQFPEMSGVLVVKPLEDTSTLNCPSARKKKARVLTKTALQGRVGDCCDEEELEGDFLNESLDAEYYDDVDFSDILVDQDTVKRSYGVVLQSTQRNATVDGCYILNTSSSSSFGCTCTHYSMSRAMCGSDGSCLTVEEQVNSAWLVNPFV